ncbi:MAG: hypothetical protein ACYTBR_14160 [Planctomycetota bacterium]
MNDNRLMRLLMVAILVTWSPGSWWCCCGTHADASEPDATPDSHAASCCSQPDDTPSPAKTVLAAGDDCCPIGSDETPSCGCLHGSIDAALPAVATTAPSADDTGQGVDLLAELPPALAGATTISRHVSACRGSPRAGPARTLLSLHCLLTT